MNRCFALHRVEQIDEGAERLGKREQPERVTGRRGVEDDALPVAAVGEVRERQQRHRLVDAGQRRVDEALNVLAVEVGAAIDDRRQRRRPIARRNPSRAAVGVELRRRERRNAGDGLTARR